MTDSIFALATAAGRAAVAIIRMSGPATGEAVRRLAGSLPKPRRASLHTLRDGRGEALDRALVLWFPAPASATGEDVAELHLHGSAAVVDAVSSALLDLGLRFALPGEFSRRAFENHKLDLAQAEGLADLVDAETQAQRRQALDQLEGGLTVRHTAWRGQIIAILATLEAAVDFPDEDLPADLARRVAPLIDQLADELRSGLADARRGERVREGYRIAIVGAPNAGKSSLLNRLTQREAAIVTPQAGTTRDVIEVHQVIGGYKVVFADTAGVRRAADEIEAEGVRRAHTWAAAADLRLMLVDGSVLDGGWRASADLTQRGDFAVITKIDLARRPDPAFRSQAADIDLALFEVSCVSGAGISQLQEALRVRVSTELAASEFPAATAERHRLRLVDAIDRLDAAAHALEAGPELAAEDVRLAARALDQITGRVGAESVLDAVFSAFCIGK